MLKRDRLPCKLNELGINLERVAEPFHIVDTEGQGELAPSEVASHILDMRGAAKGTDFARIMRQVNRMRQDTLGASGVALSRMGVHGRPEVRSAEHPPEHMHRGCVLVCWPSLGNSGADGSVAPEPSAPSRCRGQFSAFSLHHGPKHLLSVPSLLLAVGSGVPSVAPDRPW